MKSENHLIITGTIVSDPVANPSKTYVRFRLVHNFGGGKEPLFLDCVLITKAGDIPRRGAVVKICAYLRMRAGKIEAVVKSFNY